MLTGEATVFSQLGQAFKGWVSFASATDDITDPGTLEEIKGILETQYSDGITSIDKAYIDGEDIRGQFSDQLNLRLVKRYAFRISEDDIAYKMLNSKDMAAFNEVDFAATKPASGRKAPNCKPGNTRCGGRCIRGEAICKPKNNEATKEKVKAVKEKIKSTEPKTKTTKTKKTSNSEESVSAQAKPVKEGQNDQATGKTKTPNEKLKAKSTANKKLKPELDEDGLPSADALSSAKRQSLGANSYNGELIGKAKIGEKEYFVKGMLGGEKAVNNEIAVSKLAKIAGLEEHFLSVKSFDMDGKPAVATDFVKGKDTVDIVPREAFKGVPDKRKEELLAFDYLIGSQDRNPANVFVTDKGKILMIDNEFSLKNKSDNYSDFAEAYNVVAASRFIQSDNKLKPSKDFISRINKNKKEMVEEMESKGIDSTGFVNRLEKMKSGATWKELLGDEQWDALPTTRDLRKLKAEAKQKKEEFDRRIAEAQARYANSAKPKPATAATVDGLSLSAEQVAKLMATL
jgi:hypothetical protein